MTGDTLQKVRILNM